MKRIWIAVIIICIVVFLCFAEFFNINSSAEKIIHFTEFMQTDPEYSAAEKEYSKLVDSWEKDKLILLMFINHEKVDEISKSIIYIKSYMDGKDKNLLTGECLLLQEMALSLRESENPVFSNLF